MLRRTNATQRIAFRSLIAFLLQLPVQGFPHFSFLSICRIFLNIIFLNISQYGFLLFPYRICRLCNENKIEDEIHFTMQCKTFTAERESFNSNLIEICPNYKNIPTDEQKYIFLQTNEDNCFLELFGEYIFTIYNKRLQFFILIFNIVNSQKYLHLMSRIL